MRPIPNRVSRNVSRALTVLTAVLATACGDRIAGERDMRQGVPDVREAFRIGSIEGGSWETFSNIVSVAFDGDANLYVLDGTERRVTVVDREGAFVRIVGEPGQGPGQFRAPRSMAVLPDGHVVVSDGGHRSLLVFAPTGAYSGAITLDDGVMAPAMLLPYGEDGLVYTAQTLMGPMAGGTRQAPRPRSLPIRHVGLTSDRSSRLVHEAWLPALEPPRATSGAGGTTRVTRTVRAFEPETHLVVRADGSIAVADSTTYRIRVISPEGEHVATLEHPELAPTPVTDAVKERERERRRREIAEGDGPAPTVMGMGGGGAPPAMSQSQRRAILESQLDDMVFWPEIQTVQALHVDGDGRLWVSRFGDVGSPGPIDIWEEGGLRVTVPAGTFEMPDAFGPDGLAAWVEHDDLGVPFVRVGRIDRLP